MNGITKSIDGRTMLNSTLFLKWYNVTGLGGSIIAFITPILGFVDGFQDLPVGAGTIVGLLFVVVSSWFKQQEMEIKKSRENRIQSCHNEKMRIIKEVERGNIDEELGDFLIKNLEVSFEEKITK